MRGFVPDQALVGILLILLFCGSFCYGTTVEVVGLGECGDCKENNIKTSHALSGLKVTIDCKVEDGKFQTRGVGNLNEEGHFKVSLPQEILKDGKLAEECYVQLHNAANAPCAFHRGLEAAKITLVSKSNEKHTFGPTGKLKFSSAVCTSAFFWPIFKHPHLPKPSLPKGHPWLKKFGHVFPLPPLPPKIPFKKPCPPPVPVYKPKPEPPVYKPKPEPPVYKPKPEPPVYKPKPEPPVYKPKPKPEPPVYKPKPEPPVYKPKPKPPVYKPKPEPPVYKPEPKPKPPVYKPKPEPPVYKPKPEPPVYKPKPEPPVYKPKPEPPVYKPKPEPPVYKPHPKILPPPIPIYKPHPKILPPPIPIYKPLPPFYKKPCPPFSLPKLPPLPTIPPKKFHHPIIPLPPHP